MKLALAPLNPTVGDIRGNATRIVETIDRASEAGADLVVFPELAVVGYPPKDLLLKPAAIDQCARAIEWIAAHCRDVAAVVGYPAVSQAAVGLPLHNAAALCAGGRVVATHAKRLLPTYDVFDETRYFEPGPEVRPTDLDGRRIGISLCEDLWNDTELFPRPLYHMDPIGPLAEAGAELLVNVAASPFSVGKLETRRRLCANAARRHGRPVVHVNQSGGNDELIFDGHSAVLGPDGVTVAEATPFGEELLVVDWPEDAAPQPVAGHAPSPPADEVDMVHEALVVGLRDYCRKCGFGSVVLGLSGGIDSAVSACLAVEALGPSQVTGIALPSRHSSPGSRSDAAALAENLGIHFHEVPVEEPHHAVERTLAPLFEGTEPGVAEENIQARLRGLILMSVSNKFHAMLLATGNKSEMAVGYCTLYGDMAGGLAVLSDVPKTTVYQLARRMNRPGSRLHRGLGRPPVPEACIEKPPSAELRPGQKDEDTLPPYDVLDTIIDRYVEKEQSVRRIVDEAGLSEELVREVVSRIDGSEYKRKQAPPGLKITGRAFGSGRRMPIAQRFEPLG